MISAVIPVSAAAHTVAHTAGKTNNPGVLHGISLTHHAPKSD